MSFRTRSARPSTCTVCTVPPARRQYYTAYLARRYHPGKSYSMARRMCMTVDGKPLICLFRYSSSTSNSTVSTHTAPNSPNSGCRMGRLGKSIHQSPRDRKYMYHPCSTKATPASERVAFLCLLAGLFVLDARLDFAETVENCS